MQESGDVFSFFCPSRRVSYPGGCPTPMQGVLKVFSLALVEVYVLHTGKVCSETDHKQRHLKHVSWAILSKRQVLSLSPNERLLIFTRQQKTQCWLSPPHLQTCIQMPCLVQMQVGSLWLGCRFYPSLLGITMQHKTLTRTAKDSLGPYITPHFKSRRFHWVVSGETKPLLSNTMAIPCQKRANPPHEPHQSGERRSGVGERPTTLERRESKPFTRGCANSCRFSLSH